MSELEIIFNKLKNRRIVINEITEGFTYYNYYILSKEKLEKEGYNQLSYSEIIDIIQSSTLSKYYYNHIKQINEKLIVDSDVHGISHMVRTSIYVLILSVLENMSLEDFKLTLDSIIYHDIGRVNDIDDEMHGYNATKKLGFLENNYNIEDFNTIKFVIESHSLDDNKDYEILKKYDIIKENRALRILKIIKDADALDRVREYPYLNVKYLRTDSSKKLVSFSCELFNSYNVNSR